MFGRKNNTELENAKAQAHLSNERLQSVSKILLHVSEQNENLTKLTSEIIDSKEPLFAELDKYENDIPSEANSAIQSYFKNAQLETNKLLDIVESNTHFINTLKSELEEIKNQTERLIEKYGKIAKG